MREGIFAIWYKLLMIPFIITEAFINIQKLILHKNESFFPKSWKGFFKNMTELFSCTLSMSTKQKCLLGVLAFISQGTELKLEEHNSIECHFSLQFSLLSLFSSHSLLIFIFLLLLALAYPKQHFGSIITLNINKTITEY